MKPNSTMLKIMRKVEHRKCKQEDLTLLKTSFYMDQQISFTLLVISLITPNG